MDSNKVDMFILSNGKFFESNQLMYIREQLLAMDDSKWSMIQTIQFKDPTTSIIVSILAGGLGIDRFLIGDTGLGLGKLFTCGHEVDDGQWKTNHDGNQRHEVTVGSFFSF